jgi:hypothetical protein
MRPIHAMPGWLWLLLMGPTTQYSTLLKHVELTNDWGVVGEVLRFRQLEHHLSDLCLQIAHHEAELKGVSQAQATAKGCLELTHIDYFTADLHVLSTPNSQGGGRTNNRHHQQWRGMEPF